MADRGVSGPWGPQFCGALCNGETQRLQVGGRWKHIAIADRHNDLSRRDRLYYQVPTVAVPRQMFIQTRGPPAACLLNEYVLNNCLEDWGPPGARGPGARAPMVPLLIRH